MGRLSGENLPRGIGLAKHMPYLFGGQKIMRQQIWHMFRQRIHPYIAVIV
jgi:hypothetical protein